MFRKIKNDLFTQSSSEILTPPVISPITGGDLLGLEGKHIPEPVALQPFESDSGVLVLSFGEAGYQVTNRWLKKLDQLILLPEVKKLRILSVNLNMVNPQFDILSNYQIGMHVLDEVHSTSEPTREDLYKRYLASPEKDEIRNVFANWVNDLGVHQVWVVGGIQESVTTLIPIILTQLYSVLAEVNQNRISRVQVFLSLDSVSEERNNISAEMFATLKEISRLTLTSKYHLVRGEKDHVKRHDPIDDISLFSFEEGFGQVTASVMAESLITRYLFLSDLLPTMSQGLYGNDFSTLNCRVIETPVADITEYCNARLVKDQLINQDPRKNFFLGDELAHPIPANLIDLLPQEFRNDPLTKSILFNTGGKPVSILEDQVRGYSLSFQRALVKWLFTILNNDHKGLSYALSHLRALDRQLLIAEGRMVNSGKQVLINWRRSIGSVSQSIQSWISQVSNSGAIKKAIEEKIESTRVGLRALENDPVCRSITTYDADSFYTQRIQSDVGFQDLKHTDIANLSRQIGWFISSNEEDSRCDLRLVCVPNEVAVVDYLSLRDYSFGIDQFESFYQGLIRNSKNVIKSEITSGLNVMIDDLSQSELKFLYGGTASPLLDDYQIGEESIKPAVVIYGHSSEITRKIHEFNGFLTLPDTAINELPPRHYVMKRVGVVSYRGGIPMQSIQRLNRAREEYVLAPGARGHIQNLEKNATQLDRMIFNHLQAQGQNWKKGELPFTFVLLAQNLDGMKRFIKAWNRGLIKPESDLNHRKRWKLTQIQNFLPLDLGEFDERLPATSLFTALQLFCLELPAMQIDDPKHPFYGGNVDAFYRGLDEQIQLSPAGSITSMIKDIQGNDPDDKTETFIHCLGAILSN